LPNVAKPSADGWRGHAFYGSRAEHSRFLLPTSVFSLRFVSPDDTRVACPLDPPVFAMTLANLLSADQIIPHMQAQERWAAIVELTQLLVRVGKVRAEDEEVVLAALRRREETMSTGIGFGIAIPHASSDRVSEVVAAFGRAPDGIEFDSLDNAPVKFIVLFVVPKDQFQAHLRTLAAIAKLLNDRQVREALAGAGTSEEILTIFQNKAGVKTAV
jgi:mannitol/fructose-specific phosphotransferase system IIA component (Ntr-type)